MGPGQSNADPTITNREKAGKTTPRQSEDVKCQEKSETGRVPEHIARLDEIRRVADQDKSRLFLRAVPTQDYLVLLSQAGLLSARGQPETDCHLDADSGEARCYHNGDPGKDCRQSWCRYAVLMRMRLLNRLGAAYALERRRLGVL